MKKMEITRRGRTIVLAAVHKQGEEPRELWEAAHKVSEALNAAGIRHIVRTFSVPVRVPPQVPPGRGIVWRRRRVRYVAVR